MSGEPHFRDYWAGRRFTPRFIAPTPSAVWVMEGGLPVLVCVDPARLAVTGPITLARPEGSGREAHQLAATEEAVWVRWRDGLTRFDVAKHEQRSLDVPSVGLALGAETTWVLAGDGRVGRVREDSGGLELLGEPEERRQWIAVGFGAVWTLAWTPVSPRSGRSTLSRLDTSTGRVEGTLALDGLPQALLVDETAVWLYVWRWDAAREIDAYLVRVDPEALDPTSELRAPEMIGPVLDGVAYLLADDPSADAPRGQAAEVRRIDAVTGNLLSRTPVPGWVINWMVAGPSSLWGCLERRGEWPGPVVELPADGGAARIVSLDSVDLSAHLPPPPPRVDARSTEEAIRKRLADAFFGGWIARDPNTGAETRHPFVRGVTFEQVRLEGSFPTTEVVALFRSAQHPEVLFGRRQRIWDDDGAFSTVINVMDINLMEDIEACGYGLPADPKPDTSGVVWF